MCEGVNLQYIAGFFDGEGSVGIYTNGKKHYHLRVQIAQSVSKESTKLLVSLHEKYGGNLGTQISSSGREKYNLQMNNKTAKRFIEEILPHCFLKKAQIEKALEWFAGRPEAKRDKLGRMMPYPKEAKARDQEYAKLLKEMKKW